MRPTCIDKDNGIEGRPNGLGSERTGRDSLRLSFYELVSWSAERHSIRVIVDSGRQAVILSRYHRTPSDGTPINQLGFQGKDPVALKSPYDNE